LIKFNTLFINADKHQEVKIKKQTTNRICNRSRVFARGRLFFYLYNLFDWILEFGKKFKFYKRPTGTKKHPLTV